MNRKTNISRSPRLFLKRIAGHLRITGLLAASLALSLSVIIFLRGLTLWAITFGVLVLITTGFEFYWLLAPRIERKRIKRRDTENLGDEGSLYTPSNRLFDNRHPIRLFFQSCVVLYSWLLTLLSADAQLAFSGVISGSFFLYSILILAWVEYEAVRFQTNIKNYVIWGFVSILAGAVIGFAAFRIEDNWGLFALVAANGTLIALVVFFIQRIGVSEEVWAEVISELNTRLLNIPISEDQWSYIVKCIGIRLRYQRVSILEPDKERTHLNIVAQHGDYHHVVGKKIPVKNGITGRAYSTGISIASNDVLNCKYYLRLVDRDQDNTRSEIAVPITYRGETFGVLDVQSNRTMIFGPADLRSLEVIGQILGIAMAVRKSDALLQHATQMWEKISRDIQSEQDVFNTLARFARNELGADLVNYYRLSPAGFPIMKPQIVGELFEPDLIGDPIVDVYSPLLKLINDWQPYFAPKVEDHDLLYYRRKTDPPSFVVRENIKSACFVPIGTPDERLGVVFLNYRQPKNFDSLYKLMILGFAQAFATLIARERYRHLMIDGLGRPDLGLHNIQARYGLKSGVLHEGRRIFNNACNFDRDMNFNECGMFEFLTNLDKFLIEVKAQTSVDDFPWKHTLREALGNFTRRMKGQVHTEHALYISNEIDNLIEREPAWTRLAIYRVITEAINNAVFHGKADEIEIKTKRLDNTITISVINNNEPLPDDAERHSSRGGIFALLQELRDQFGARTSIRKCDDGSGTIVSAEIPVLPLNVEVSEL